MECIEYSPFSAFCLVTSACAMSLRNKWKTKTVLYADSAVELDLYCKPSLFA